MYYVYILLSQKDSNFYTGFTSNLKGRIEEHESGLSNSTKHRRPLILVYYEACINRKDAMHREKYLKTTYGKRYLKNRMRNYFNEKQVIYYTGAEAFRSWRYTKYFVSKLSIAECEAAETQVWNDFAFSCKYIDKATHDKLFDKYDHIIAMIVNMINKPEKWTL